MLHGFLFDTLRYRRPSLRHNTVQVVEFSEFEREGKDMDEAELKHLAELQNSKRSIMFLG